MADVEFEKRGRAGIVTFNRPKALNALNLEMLDALSLQYKQWSADPDIYVVLQTSSAQRAFCAGADVRQIRQDLIDQNGKTQTFFEKEYAFNWQLDRFDKPHIAMWQGAVMGGGVGVSLFGTHRIADSDLKFAMPETGIGLFPDVGAAYFFNQLETPLGLYLGLTGRVLDAFDACELGLATHHIPSSKWPQIINALEQATPIDPLLDDLHVAPVKGDSVFNDLDAIQKYFGPATIEECYAFLQDGRKTGDEFADRTLNRLGERSPFALKLTMQYFDFSKGLTLQQVLKNDLRLIDYALQQPDFQEGVRSLLIDKDKSSNWKFTRLEDVPNINFEEFL